MCDWTLKLDKSQFVSASHHASGASSSTGHNYLENLRLVYFGVTEHFGEVDASYFKH
uniref:Uncharacterized protein n=1 Tax=Meloidogyne enterolobii TaxID=390850 RepID=A0A6V7XX31_MELEN|nr:unnamed protein product [Meloidogyne enterolobii]